MIKYLLLTFFAGNLTAQTTLDVHVYDWANVPASTIDQAGKVVAGILRLSGIELRWIMESPDSPEARKVILDEPPRPGRERQAACAARRASGPLSSRNGRVGSGLFAPSGR